MRWFRWRARPASSAYGRSKGVVPEQLRERFDYLDSLPAGDPPAPWRRVGVVAVGGLLQVGFAAGTDLLLIVSHSGRGVVDCATGERLARDDCDYWADSSALEADGIGPLDGQRIRIAGAGGGSLSQATEDGWSIERHPLSWPADELILCPPGEDMLVQAPGAGRGLAKLRPLPSELRAFGFSPTGRSLVIATASDVEIFHRP